MSEATLYLPSSARRAAAPAAGGLLESIPLLTGIGLMVSAAVSSRVIYQVMSTGVFFDPDDAMRMAQVRDLMNGQGWFDLTSWRMDPPHGVFMHWTRIVDAPIAALAWLFQLFTNVETAQRLTQLAFPLSLYAGLLAVSARMARLLVGAQGPLLAITSTLFGSAIFGYFAPGRLDHDHVAILALMLMAASLIEALEPGRSRAAALTGLAAAGSLSVSLETLPFIIVGIAILPTAWIIQGAAMAANLRAFALALGGGLIAGFVVTVAPARYLNGACDMLSAAHMVAGLTGAALCIGLSTATQRLTSVAMRLMAAGGAGAMTIAGLALTYPACLADPLASVDPLLREHWLSQVSEARPLLESLNYVPGLALFVIAPTLLGLGGLALAVLFERGVARARFLALLALTLAGCATSLWQVRASGVTAPLALFGSVWLAARVGAFAAARGMRLALPLSLLAALSQTPVFLAPFAPPNPPPKNHAAAENNFGCWEPSAFTAIAGLPQGTVLASIDHGGHLLALTGHGVIAAQFHRNTHGNLVAVNAFRADAASAESIVRGAGARYVLFCPDAGDMEYYRGIAPAGFAAKLLRNEIPTWLKPLPLDTPYKVFELR